MATMISKKSLISLGKRSINWVKTQSHPSTLRKEMRALGSIARKILREQSCWERQQTLRRSFRQSLLFSSVTLRQWGRKSTAISLSSGQPSPNASPFMRRKPGECLHWPIMFWAPCTGLQPIKPIRASFWSQYIRGPHHKTFRQPVDKRRLSTMQIISAEFKQNLKSTKMCTSTLINSQKNATISDF